MKLEKTINKNLLDNSLSSEYYKSLLDHIVECVWLFDYTNKYYKYISPSIYNLRGLTVEEAMKESLEDSLTPDSLQKIVNSGFKRYPRFMAGDRSDEVVCDTCEYEQYCKDGSIKNIEISTRIVFNEETQSIDVVGVSRDITKRKHYEKELIEKLREKNEQLNTEKTNEHSTYPRIYFFRKFVVYGSDSTVPVKWRTKKTEELFSFLLHRDNNTISKSDICEALWPDTTIDKSTTYLHTNVNNMKKDLLSVGIQLEVTFNNGCYVYQMPPFYSDILEFKDIIENTILPFDSLDDNSAGNYEKAISLYKKDYLADNGYTWSLARSTTYRSQFESAAFALSRYYFLQHNYNATKKILNKLIDIDNLNENVHELLLKIYYEEHESCSFFNHYKYFKNLLSSELGIEPKDSIQKLYNEFYLIVNEPLSEDASHF